MPRPEHQKRNSAPLRIGILSADGANLRKAAWVSRGPGGIVFGIARGDGLGTKYTYRSDGGLYQSIYAQTPSGPKESQKLTADLPAISEIKGLVKFYSVELGVKDRLRGFPFKRNFESIYVRTQEGRVSFKMGLLEPGVPQALDPIGRGQENHFRLITKIVPWIVIWNSAGFASVAHR